MPNPLDPRELHAVFAGFPGGLNSYDEAMALPVQQAGAAKNIRFSGISGYPEIRLGGKNYLDRSYRILGDACRNAWRYRNADGAKKIIVQSGDRVYADSNDGKFDEIFQPVTNDGYVRFAQFRSVLIATSEREDVRLWHPTDGSVKLSPRVNALGFVPNHNTATTGGFLKDRRYSYRFTADLHHGDDFICESYPAGEVSGETKTFSQVNATLTAGAADTSKVELLRTGTWFETSGLTIKRINVYRSIVYDGSPPLIDGLDANFFYIGSVDYQTALVDVSAPAIWFTDTGQMPKRQIRYDALINPPRGRFPLLFRNSLFLANVEDYNENDEVWEKFPSRVYASEMGPRGPEIARFSGLRGWDIDPDAGRSITGIAGFKEHTLLVFKPDQTWRIRFSNTGQFTSETDVYIDRVSASVGCNAPQTITNVDNAVAWLSGDNAYYYDGSGVNELGGHVMSSVLSSIPAALRLHATADFNPTRKEFSIYHAKLGTPFNRFVARFDGRFGRWSADELTRGVGAVVQSVDDDGERKYLWCLQDENDTFDKTNQDALVIEADTGHIEASLTQGPLGGTRDDISWSFSTGYLDFGQPHRNKVVTRVLILGEINRTATLHFEVDNRVNTFNGAGYPFAYKQGAGAQWDTSDWNDSDWVDGEVRRAAIANVTSPVRGKAHKLTFQGFSDGPMAITRIVIYYKLEAEGGTR